MSGESECSKVTIYMIGDSTMADKSPDQEFERGWGQMLPLFVKEEAVVSNHARNGRSSKSFLDEGLWEPVYNSMKPGDWLIIQFGHNDQKPDEKRHTEPFTTYMDHLRFYVEQARSKGAVPIICTSIVRGWFKDGALQDSHGDYIQAAVQAAEELDVPLLDLEKRTRELVSELGEARLTVYYVPYDTTHLSPWGATRTAQMACEEIKKLNLPLAEYLG